MSSDDPPSPGPAVPPPPPPPPAAAAQAPSQSPPQSQQSPPQTTTSPTAATHRASPPRPLPPIENHLIDTSAKWSTFDIMLRTAQPDKTLIAFDAEWHNDQLCLVQIAFCPISECTGTRRYGVKPQSITVCTIDCVLLDKREVSRRLRVLLTDVRLRKLAFDCREDCKMFQLHFDVMTSGIFDLQLLERLTREESRSRSIYNLAGLKSLLNEFDALQSFREAKAAQNLTQEGSSVVFLDRPLPQAVLDYAACDVACLFPLFEQLRQRPLFTSRPGAISDEVLRGSIAYSTLNMWVPQEFRRHNMLPLGVLDSLAPAQGSKICDGCHRAVAPSSQRFCKICHVIFKRDFETKDPANPAAGVGQSPPQNDDDLVIA